MMLRVALRSLMTRPIRAAVLAGGFGFGIGVMAALLGVGQVILEQAHAPALARRRRHGDRRAVRLGVERPLPDLERARRARPGAACQDGVAVAERPAVPDDAGGTDRRRGDRRHSQPREGVRRSRCPASPRGSTRPATSGGCIPIAATCCARWIAFTSCRTCNARATSWAEWLYFNGRTRDGRLRFYLTFLVGPRRPRRERRGRRPAAARSRRAGRRTTRPQTEVDDARCSPAAPDLDIAGNRVRLDGLRYRITLALPGAGGDTHARRRAGTVAAAGDDSRRARLGHRLHRAGVVGNDARRRCESAASR